MTSAFAAAAATPIVLRSETKANVCLSSLALAEA